MVNSPNQKIMQQSAYSGFSNKKQARLSIYDKYIDKSPQRSSSKPINLMFESLGVKQKVTSQSTGSLLNPRVPRKSFTKAQNYSHTQEKEDQSVENENQSQYSSILIKQQQQATESNAPNRKMRIKIIKFS
ncbi:hypothetical protein PPERSA_09840 [Pseudocohnilembus persalinus]|uniref:Uncharacterized protein n=1 Tax=Pseudocohnilembus persalinus TaxID=266149 RepID=A0A0V0QTX3_PSEPJ|nr:hypothetical protein PPERSA_09840 [Pseudocohnilembus persalinus]|eukprot:KRX05700.1 hypothetical protein PPERSA_09840 [Pseudocohnilembus persalinus]